MDARETTGGMVRGGGVPIAPRQPIGMGLPDRECPDRWLDRIHPHRTVRATSTRRRWRSSKRRRHQALIRGIRLAPTARTEVGMGALLAALIIAGGMVGSVWMYANLPPPRWHGFRVTDTSVGVVEETTGDVMLCTVGSGCVRVGSATIPISTKAAKEK